MPLSPHMVARLTRAEQCQARSRPVDHRPIWAQDPEAYQAWAEAGMIASCGSVEAYMDRLFRAGAEQGQDCFASLCKQLQVPEETMAQWWETTYTVYAPSTGGRHH